MVRSRILMHGAIAALLLGGATAGALHAGAEGNAKAREAFAEADRYFKTGDARSARIELMNAIKADPNWVAARVAQARILIELGDGLAAEAELRKALELGAPAASLRHQLGQAYFMQGKLDDARRQLQATDIPAKHQGEAALLLGRVALAQGERALAAQSFDRAAKLIPDDPMLWVDIARMRAGGGDQAGAIAAVEEALARDEANVAALEYRAILMRDQFGLLAALPWFERALQVAPDNVDLLLEYGATLGEAGRNRDMLIAVRHAMSISPDHPRGFFLQAGLAARAGKFKLAQQLLVRMDGKMEEVPAVILLRGVTAYGDGNYNAAVEAFRLLLSRQPNNRQAQMLLARALQMSGDHRDVIDLMKRSVNRADADVYALWLTGRSLEALDARAEAVGLFNRASFHRGAETKAFVQETPINVLRAEAMRAPSDARVMIPYIRALYDNGQRGEAYAQAQRLQRENLGAVDAHLLAADAAMGVGNYGAAINALTDARAIRFSEPVMLRMVEAYGALGNGPAAAEVLTQFLTYNPTNLEALRLLAFGHLQAQNFGAARPILEKLIERIGDRDALLLVGLTEAQLGEGDVEAARETAARAYALQPSSPMVTHSYGMVLLREGGRRQDALDLLEKAVTIAPQNMVFRTNYDQARALASRRKSRAG